MLRVSPQPLTMVSWAYMTPAFIRIEPCNRLRGGKSPHPGGCDQRLLHAADRDATNELALEQEEDHDHGHRGDDRAGHQQVPHRTVADDKEREAKRQRP